MSVFDVKSLVSGARRVAENVAEFGAGFERGAGEDLRLEVSGSGVDIVPFNPAPQTTKPNASRIGILLLVALLVAMR